MKNRLLGIIFFLMILLFFSCGNEENSQNVIVSSSNEKKIDSTFCQEIGRKLIGKFYERDSLSFDQLISGIHFSKRFITNDSLRNDFITKRFNLYTEFNTIVDQGGRIDLLQAFQSDSICKIIIRGYIPPQEINYWQISLSGYQHSYTVEDVFSFRYGKTNYEIWKTIEERLNLLSKEQERIALKSVSYLDTSFMFLQQNNLEAAKESLTRIDPSLVGTFLIDYHRFRLATYSTEEERQNYLINWMRRMDRGSSSYWMYYFYYSATNGQYGQARIALENLKDKVGKDPLLKYLEGITYFEESDYSRAIELYDEVLAQIQDIPDVHYAKVVCLIEMKEYVEAVESLLVMEDYFDVTSVNWDKEFIGYPEFVMSDEFDRFLERVSAL